MPVTLTSPDGQFSRQYNSKEDMVEKLEAMDGLPDHIALDGRITGVFAKMANQPMNKKVVVLHETLSKSGFIINENE